MNSHDIFWNQKRNVQLTRTALLDFLTARCAGQVTAKEPVFREAKNLDLFDVKGLCLLRLNSLRSAAIVVGSSQPEFAARFFSVVEAPAGAPKADPKMIEKDLIKALFSALETELKAMEPKFDSKSAIPVVGRRLGSWGTVSTSRSVQFPFQTPQGELIFEIPVFDDQYHQEAMKAFYGFPEDARIMVVDDSPTTRRLVRDVLASVGYQNIDECGDGEAAFKKLQGTRPEFDLLIADWHMPELTGIDLLRRVRATRDTKNLPVILATGEKNQEEVWTAVKEGVSGYVMKPYEDETLYSAMRKAAEVRFKRQAA